MAATSRILVLDLEGTLISSAVSQIPRPGLHDFLTECSRLFSRIVLMTTVREEVARKIVQLLAAEGSAPAWLADIEYIQWDGKFKDLFFVPGVADVSHITLLDDMQEYVADGQEERHVWISSYDPSLLVDDYGFPEVLEDLRRRVRGERFG